MLGTYHSTTGAIKADLSRYPCHARHRVPGSIAIVYIRYRASKISAQVFVFWGVFFFSNTVTIIACKATSTLGHNLPIEMYHWLSHFFVCSNSYAVVMLVSLSESLPCPAASSLSLCKSPYTVPSCLFLLPLVGLLLPGVAFLFRAC